MNITFLSDYLKVQITTKRKINKMSLIQKAPVVSKELILPFVLITTLFAQWVIANDITNPMVSAFKKNIGTE